MNEALLINEDGLSILSFAEGDHLLLTVHVLSLLAGEDNALAWMRL